MRTQLSNDGIPVAVNVGGPGCGPSMAGAVEQTVRKWRWEPWLVEGQPAPVSTAFEVYYSESTAAARGGGLGPDADGAYRAHYGIVELKDQVAPKYPEAARTEGLPDQRCLCKVKIAEDGVPYEVEVTNCPDVFHAPTEDAILLWRWHPPLVDGQPVKAQITIGVNFRRE